MRFALVPLLCLFALAGLAQSPVYQRVSIPIEGPSDFYELLHLGLAIDHAYFGPDKSLIHDFNASDLAKLTYAGFSYSIIVDDLSSFYAAQCADPAHFHSHSPIINEDCEVEVIEIETPINFQEGSMGGYLTYEEALEELDQMQALFPDLISVKQVINDQLTHEGRPIHWVRISDNPNDDEDEPEVLYDALTHAREPMGLMQMTFYMWYLLENYETDDEIRFIVDNTELYFVPVVNPDGYVYNETIEPNGGGLWRKNRRLNPDGTYGVDLNRNFGFGWGYDDFGSSPIPESAVYRGPEANSEPETQMLQDFCNNHAFQFALNYHCYGNLLILPWGYLDSPTNEEEAFDLFAEALTKENNYLAGSPLETVGYTANGVVDDWMYGDVQEKEAIYSMTPEVGPAFLGFWPPAALMEDLAKTALRQNINLAQLPHNFGLIDLTYEDVLIGTDGQVEFDLKKYGLLDGSFELSLNTLVTDILVTDPTVTVTPAFGETASGSFYFLVGPNTAAGTVIPFVLSINNGQYVQDLAFEINYVGQGIQETEELLSSGEDLTAWEETNDWGLTSAEYYSAPGSITDSPVGSYNNNAENVLTSQAFTIPSSADEAWLEFYTKWDIESGYDYVQIQVEDLSNNSIEPLCGLYTNNGAGGFQPLDEPLYDGTQDSWVLELMDLSPYIGQEIQIHYVLRSDNWVEEDGFYFDDMEAYTISNDIIDHTIQVFEQQKVQVYPNPGAHTLNIESKTTAMYHVEVYDLYGRLIHQSIVDNTSFQINTSFWRKGMYSIQIQTDESVELVSWVKQ